MPGGSPVPNRYIKSELKSHRLLWEEERPIRWPYMKILREYSTLKEFYPDINPYVEAYRMRENVWALFQESMDGAGDLWMYVINGPERVLLIDTGFGVGDLKGLVQHLVGKCSVCPLLLPSGRRILHATDHESAYLGLSV